MKTFKAIIDEFIKFIKDNNLIYEDAFLHIDFVSCVKVGYGFDFEFENDALTAMQVSGPIERFVPSLASYLDDEDLCREVDMATLNDVFSKVEKDIVNYNMEKE